MAPHSTSFGHTHEAARVDPATRVRQSYSPQDCPPPCPACGGLECLCRPRFFQGQLLTDEDLNRLDHYIVAKNRLHNRYLHGHGVVCGLEVTCHPCDNKSVIVKTGYALSPCGDDIVVCKESPVNICDLINRCRPVTHDSCDPMHPGSTDTCPEGPQDWVLAICYDEKLSRGVTALRANVSGICCAQCGSTNIGTCGCSARPSSHGNGHTNSTGRISQSKKPLAQCEPTIICETYTFVVYKQPKPERMEGLNSKLVETMKAFREEMPNPLPLDASLKEHHEFAHAVYRGILNYASRLDCPNLAQLRTELDKVKIEPAEGYTGALGAYQKSIATSVGRLALAAAPSFRERICKLLMPVCPPPAHRNCVPLATIKVFSKDQECRVMSICNRRNRELALTVPLIEFWFASVWQKVKFYLDELCCPTREAQNIPPVTAIRPREEVAFVETAETDADRARRSRRMLSKSFAGSEKAVVPEMLALGLLGSLDEQGNPVLSEEDLTEPLSRVVFDQVLKPALQDLVPESWMKTIGAISKTEDSSHPGLPTGPASITKIGEDVTNLKAQLKSQQKTIADLKQSLQRLSRRDNG